MDFSPHSMAPLGAASSSQPCSALSPGTGALILQKGEVRVINQTTCEELMPQQITPRMMCVGFLAGGVDACQVCERPEEWGGGGGGALGGWGLMQGLFHSGRLRGPVVQRGGRWSNLPGRCGELG
jgi:hypothetical protein